jgi:hypothetical protein
MHLSPESIASFLTSWPFINIGIPCLSVIAGIFVKVVSRPDPGLKIKSDDLAVGFDIGVGALIIFVTKMVAASKELQAVADPKFQTELQSRIISAPWLLLLWLMGLWGLSTIIRKWGWKNPGGNPPANDNLTWHLGIVVPLVFGIVSLLLAVNWTGGDK